MRFLPLVQGGSLCVSRWDGRSGGSGRNGERHQASMILAAASILIGSLLGSGAPAKANDLDQGAGAAMRAYLMGEGASASVAPVQATKPSSPASAASGPKFADADSLFGAMKDFLQERNGSAPEGPAAPKYVAPAGPVGESPRPGAIFVGSKTCLGCHTPDSETFSHTLMGRIAAQGKLECETCHGQPRFTYTTWDARPVTGRAGSAQGPECQVLPGRSTNISSRR